jgi:hypothetical protein
MKKQLHEKLDSVPTWAQPFLGLALLIGAFVVVAVLLCLAPVWLPLLLGWAFFCEVRHKLSDTPTNEPALGAPPAPDRQRIDR